MEAWLMQPLNSITLPLSDLFSIYLFIFRQDLTISLAILELVETKLGLNSQRPISLFPSVGIQGT